MWNWGYCRIEYNRKPRNPKIPQITAQVQLMPLPSCLASASSWTHRAPSKTQWPSCIRPALHQSTCGSTCRLLWLPAVLVCAVQISKFSFPARTREWVQRLRITDGSMLSCWDVGWFWCYSLDPYGWCLQLLGGFLPCKVSDLGGATTSLRRAQQRTSEILARSRSWLSLLRSPSGIRISFLMPIVFKSCRLETQERKMTWTCVKELVTQLSQIVPTNFFRQSPPEDLEVTRWGNINGNCKQCKPPCCRGDANWQPTPFSSCLVTGPFLP